MNPVSFARHLLTYNALWRRSVYSCHDGISALCKMFALSNMCIVVFGLRSWNSFPSPDNTGICDLTRIGFSCVILHSGTSATVPSMPWKSLSGHLGICILDGQDLDHVFHNSKLNLTLLRAIQSRISVWILQLWKLGKWGLIRLWLSKMRSTPYPAGCGNNCQLPFPLQAVSWSTIVDHWNFSITERT